MPRPVADSVIVISSASSSEEEGEGRGGSKSRARHVHRSPAASSVGGEKGDGVRRSKKRKKENGAATVEEDRRANEESGPERRAKPKAPKKKQEKEKEPPSSSANAGEAVASGGEFAHPSIIFALPATGRGGGKKTDVVKKKKKRDVETSAIANGKVRGKGEERKSNVKRKGKNGEDTEDKSSSSSYAGDVVATSDEVGRPSPTCSFPMRRVKRLIAGSEDGVRKSGVRTSLDAVFLINKASEFFLELFARDAYAHAAQEHKRALFYKHLSSTVCVEKRYEFLSDFVPEKVRAEDALKALAEQP